MSLPGTQYEKWNETKIWKTSAAPFYNLSQNTRRQNAKSIQVEEIDVFQLNKDESISTSKVNEQVSPAQWGNYKKKS